MLTKIITDGSTRRNPDGPGGWAALLRHGKHERLISGRAQGATNNVMEITAALMGLRELTREGCEVEVVTDSKYLIGQMTEGWKRKKNHELLAELEAEVAKHRVTFRHVKGHAGDTDNERVHQAAYQESGIALSEEQKGKKSVTAHSLPWEEKKRRDDEYRENMKLRPDDIDFLKEQGWPEHVIQNAIRTGFRGTHLYGMTPFEKRDVGISRPGAYILTPNGPGELYHLAGEKVGVLLDNAERDGKGNPVMTFFHYELVEPMPQQTYG